MESRKGDREAVLPVPFDPCPLSTPTYRNISAVPIVDEDGRVIDLYHRFDVTFIALAGDAEQTMSNLNMCLSDLLPQRRGR